MAMSSEFRVYVFRLTPHQDLKKEILDFAMRNKIQAGIILTCVGSLECLNLRYANRKEGSEAKGHFEIVSLTGTFSQASAHFHISVSDHEGKTFGGHLLNGNLIYTTVEIAVAELPDLTFERGVDPTYGYHELIVKSKKTDE
jgi:predicted DNA-binding protein with PD1-like motif